jgi:AI-2 transport protein TqsA
MKTEHHRAIQTYSLLVIALILSASALYWLKPVLIPFVLSIMVSMGLSPLVQWLERAGRLPAWAAVSVALCLSLLIVVGLSVLVGGSLKTAVSQAGELETRLHGVYEMTLLRLQESGFDIDRASVTEQLKSLPVGRTFGNMVSGLLNVVSDSFLILFFLVYLLQSTGERSENADSVSAAIRAKVRQYLSIKLSLSLLTGGLVWITLMMFGVPMAAMFGVLTVVLNFIPSVGSIIATLLPMPFILLNPDLSGGMVLAILIITGIIQTLIGNILEPKLLGDSLELHPITILVTLVFWGMLWGVPGMFLATPLTAVVCILMNAFAPTRPFAQLLAGRGFQKAVID